MLAGLLHWRQPALLHCRHPQPPPRRLRRSRQLLRRPLHPRLQKPHPRRRWPVRWRAAWAPRSNCREGLTQHAVSDW